MGIPGLAEVLLYLVLAVAAGFVVYELSMLGVRRWRRRRRGRGG